MSPGVDEEAPPGRPSAAGDFEIYRQLFEEAGDVLFAATPDGTLVEINRRAEDLTNLPRQELLGRPFGSLLAEADRVRGLADFARAATGDPVRAEYRLQTVFGEVWFQVSLQPVRLGDDSVLVHGIARDVQVQRDLESQLERHNFELQSLLDACTAIGVRRTFDELVQSISFEAFQLIRRNAAITLYASRAPGASPQIVSVAGRSSRVAEGGTLLHCDDEVETHVHRAMETRKTLWLSDNNGFETESGRQVSSFAVVPLLADAGERVVGAILAETLGDGFLGDDAVALLRAFADRAAAAVDNLSLSEERLRIADEQCAIVENLGDGVLVVDADNRVVDANPAAAQMLASWSLANEEEVMSPSGWSIARLDGTPLPTSELPTLIAIREGRSVPQRSLILHTVIGDRILTISAEPLHHPDTPPEEVRASQRAATLVFRDMTRQIALMTELERRAADLSAEKEAFRRYAQALSQFEDAVVITSPGGRVEEWLGAAPRVFGRAAAEVLGQSVSSVLVATEDQGPLGEDLERTTGWSREMPLRRTDGTVMVALVTASPVQDDSGAIVARVLLVKDVTEQRKLRESLTRTQRMEGLGTLAGGVAHEINNPLAVLSMNLSTLKEVHERLARLVAGAAAEGAQVEARELVEESVHAAARIASIVRTLHVFSRSHKDDDADVTISQLVDSAAAVALNEIRHRAVLIKHYDAAAATVRAHAQELEQAILNVILNAVQAIPEGDVDRHRIVLRIGQTGDQVRIDVEDTGEGIPEELRTKIFDPFVTGRPGERTGLGLSVTHDVVTRLGGRIDVDSALARGTRVSIFLPAVTPRGLSEPPKASAIARRRRILVVEDEPYLRKAYRRILSSRYDVVDIGSGEEALERMRSERFDLILCDLQMPGMSGADLYDRGLAEGVANEQEFLFVTGGAFTPHVKQFADHHAARCLLKPVEVAVLLLRIEDELAARPL